MTKDKLDICTMCHIQLDELREACSMSVTNWAAFGQCQTAWTF